MTMSDDLYFCWIMITTLENQKLNTFIDKSKNPFISCESHNNKSSKCKKTKSAAGSWNLKMIIGPFNRLESIEFKKLWKAESRGIKSRLNRGIELAVSHEKICWDADVK
jgi:hypothetical protein